MDNIDWALMVVWFFFLVAGRTWDEKLFSISGGILGIFLMLEVLADSFLFGLGLLIINAYIIWINVTPKR